MNFKISDYAILYKSLQILCKRLECEFFDLEVVFQKDVKEPLLQEGKIICNIDGNYLDTIVSIYAVYVHHLDKITGRNIDNLEFRNGLIRYFLIIVRDFMLEYSSKRKRDVNDKITMKLDQFHVVWILLKNIICPYKNIELQNVRILAQNSAQFDAVKVVNIKGEDILFVNLDVEKSAARSAFMLVESMRLLMKNKDETPEAVLREMFTNYFMKEKLVDFLAMAFGDDQDISNFLAVLSVLCQSQELENMAMQVKKNVKVAQSNPYVGNWWFLGLTEKMLESVRGPDYSTTISLKDFSKDLWEKVEKERKARGLSEVPFEMLLRIQSQDLTTPPNQTLQQLLSKARIW